MSRTETRAAPEKGIALPALGVQTLLAGQPHVLRLPLQPQPARPLVRVYQDLSTAGELCWGYDLKPGPSHGDLGYADGSTRPLRVERCRAWRCPLPLGSTVWVRETWAELCNQPDECCVGSEATAEQIEAHRAQWHYAEYRADTPGARYPGGWDECLEPGERSLGPDVPRWRSATSMPRRFARLFAKVVSAEPVLGDGGWEWRVELRRVEMPGVGE